MYGDSSRSGYFDDVYEDCREITTVSDFTRWMINEKPRTKSMYLANIPLISLLADPIHIQLPYDILQYSIPDSPIIYMGKGRQRTPLHFDPTGNLILLVRGEKTFDLFSPHVSPLLRPIGGIMASIMSWYGGFIPAVYSRFRGDEESLDCFRLRVKMRAGQALWMPPCWWHSVTGGVDPNIILVYPTMPR